MRPDLPAHLLHINLTPKTSTLYCFTDPSFSSFWLHIKRLLRIDLYSSPNYLQ